jgi:activator of HSP90 ATPase
MDTLEVEDVIPASANRIFSDWLSSAGHTSMTGGEAVYANNEFTAWDGYISGSNLNNDENKTIRQKWRTVEFPENAEDSIIEVELKPIDKESTKVVIKQTYLPDGDGPKYTDGWRQHYFQPMKEFYSKNK